MAKASKRSGMKAAGFSKPQTRRPSATTAPARPAEPPAGPAPVELSAAPPPAALPASAIVSVIEAAVSSGIRAALAVSQSAGAGPSAAPPVVPPSPTSPQPARLPASVMPAVSRAAAAAFALSPPQAAPRARFALDALAPDKRRVNSSMDPRLQMAVARARTGARRPATSSTAADEVAVVAKVSDLERWDALGDTRGAAVIARTDGDGAIVTARLPASRIEAVRQQPFVVSLKAARPVLAALAKSIEETGARADLLPAGTAPDGGRGVVVGIVDFGCDFAHQNFRRPDGSTRVEAIWQQGATGFAGGPFGYGRLYTAPEINAALAAPDPYTALGYGPDPDTPFQTGTHGTHVMDIAAGNGSGTGPTALPPGFAPDATILFVDLAATDVPWDGADAVGKNFGDSVQLLEAIRFIFDRAGNRPCVVNLSLGTNGGPHDGSTLVEQGIDALINERPNRSVVIAASNSHDDGIHAAGTVPANGSADLLWDLHADNEPAEVEVWLPAGARVAVELIGPDGTALPVIEPGDSRSFKDGNTVVIHLANRLNEPNNGDNTVGIYVAGVFPAGQWVVRLHARDGAPAPYHAWIERYDVAQSSFDPAQQDATHTLGSISCGRHTIAVGSYDAHRNPVLPLSYFSSEGPTRDARQKPEVSAPGHGVVAAWSRTGNRVVSKSGTSMAAPAVTGLIALVYAEALRKGKALTAQQLQDIITQAARQNPPAGAAGNWDARYGFGRLSADAIARV